MADKESEDSVDHPCDADRSEGILNAGEIEARSTDHVSHSDELMDEEEGGSLSDALSNDMHCPPIGSSSDSEAATDNVYSARLVIRDIEVENFKSYSGTHRIGPFHKTFTAVIGPNGSGKSNVIDAMLFVFGRNAKKIRLEKLTELIHNSAAFPNLSYASVTVRFGSVLETRAQEKDPEQRTDIAGRDLRIKREVYRSGTSQYFIDGVRKTQKEVIERLTMEGVDLEHNRFLILQGEVEQIALMKPKADKEGEEGLLEYLDDLIGTNEFVERISIATNTANDAQVVRLEALDRERKLKSEREALDDAKNSTLNFVTKDNHLQRTLIAMCQLRMRGIEAKLVEPRRLIGEIDARITSLGDEVNIRRDAKSKSEELAAKTKKELAEATKERDAVRSRKHTAEAAVEEARSGEAQQERAKKKVAEQLKKAEDDAEKAQLQRNDAEREAVIHQTNLDEATQEVASLQAKHDRMSEELLPKLRPLRHMLEEKRRVIAPYERAVTEAEEQLRTARSRLETLECEEGKRVDSLYQLEQAAEGDAVRMEELGNILKGAEGGEHREEMQRLQGVVEEAAKRKHVINSTIQDLKSVYREGEADDRAMEFLLSQRSLKGYYGTLRQLGRIDDAYDIAAGVASNAWGFHVVQDRATATTALQLLKKNNIGRATMMVIDEIQREMGERASKSFTPPNAKATRIFDLIKPTNPIFRVVFYQAVRDTLVVSTLTAARETAFGNGQQRYRVVSHKGELVEPNGTIVGGGAAPRGAKLKAARSPQDKQAAKEELQRLQQQLIHAAEEERAAQLQLHQLREKINQLSPEQLRRLRSEYRSLAAKVDNDKQRCAQLRQELQDARVELQSKRAFLLDSIATEETAVEKAHKHLLKHTKDVEDVEAEMESVGGSAFKEVEVALAEQQQRVDAEEAALRGCRRLAQKLRATYERKLANKEEFMKALARIEEEVADTVRGQLVERETHLQELVQQLEEAEAALARAQAASEAARAAIPIANSSLVEAQKQLDDEHRYRQTESAKIADVLQELAKFEQKIDACEEKIKENVELYGIETLQLERRAGEQEIDGVGDEGDEDSSDDDEEAENDDVQDQARRRRGRQRGNGEGRSKELTSESIRNMSFKHTQEELDHCDYDRSVHLAKALSEETKRLHSEIDFRAVALWRERDQAHRHALSVYMEKKDISDHAEKVLTELKETRRAAFMAAFGSIQKKLKEVYQMLTHGGDADMELVDMNDPFEGINFVVRPPKKSWKQISNLSGGEKTLSSLALIFALHHIKPTPIYVMDEIDAALDFRNVSIVANYVLRQAIGAQFIIISLRNNMFEMAHQLVGVCKVNDVTRTLVLIPRAFLRIMQARASTDARASHKMAASACVTDRKDATQTTDEAAGRPSDEGGRPSRKTVRFGEGQSSDKVNGYCSEDVQGGMASGPPVVKVRHDALSFSEGKDEEDTLV